MKVLAIHFQPDQQLSACQIYRTNMPYYYLRQHGWSAEWENWSKIKEQHEKYGKEVYLRLASNYDVFVFPRLTAPPDSQMLEGLMALFYLIRLAGKRIVYEVDDDFSNKHRDLTPMGVHRAMEIASWADAITVTTPYLGELMRKETRRPVYVLPNMIEPQLWKRPDQSIAHEGVVIGLTGSPTHYYDWLVLKEVIPSLLAKHPTARFQVMGFHPDYLRELPEVQFLPPVAYDQYVEVIRSCDIVLAPVDPTDTFNLSKSPIKVIEGMAATRPIGSAMGGAACIATDNLVYRLAIENGKNGLLCTHTPEAWYTAIDRLLSNPQERERLALAGHQWVWKRHDISATWVEWSRAYHKIVDKPRNTHPMPLFREASASA